MSVAIVNFMFVWNKSKNLHLKWKIHELSLFRYFSPDEWRMETSVEEEKVQKYITNNAYGFDLQDLNLIDKNRTKYKTDASLHNNLTPGCGFHMPGFVGD